jgi:hypothetical protein
MGGCHIAEATAHGRQKRMDSTSLTFRKAIKGNAKAVPSRSQTTAEAAICKSSKTDQRLLLNLIHWKERYGGLDFAVGHEQNVRVAMYLETSACVS